MDNYYQHIRLMILGVFISLSMSSFSQTINFSVEGKSVEERDTFVVAVQADSNLTGEGIFAYRFHITYNANYLEFLGVEDVGDILTGWGLPTTNLVSPGNLRLAGAGANALTGTGDVIYLRFRATRHGNTYIGFNNAQSYLNEGAPASAYTSGYIIASQRSFPNISPDSGQLFVGDEITLSASGGLEPYTFGSENTAVAQVVNDNTLRAIGPGTTRAYVTDNNAETNYTTGVMDVRAIRMSIPNDLTVYPSQTVLVPLQIEVAPGTQVFSGTIELSYPGGLTPAETPVQQGDYSISVERRIHSNRVSLSFASGTGIAGNGVLVYVPFVGISPGNQYISFQSAMFNESLLSFVTNNYVQVNTLPNLTISPTSGSLMWGETINMSVSNGNPPYSYSVSDANVASVDAAGVVSGLSGGTFTVTATDNVGATVTSGTFTVNDHTLSINNTDGDLDNDTRVAVSTSQLPSGRNIFSFEGEVTFQTQYLNFVGVEAADPGMLIETTVDGNTIQLVGAGSNPISSGNVFYLLFRIKNALSIFSNTAVNFNGFTINEGNINSVLANGRVTRVEQASYRPVADAGANFSVDENTPAQLDGSGSYDNDGDPFTYLWIAPAGITLDDPTLVDPSFTAPEVHQNTNFTFSLVTNDGTSNSDTSKVTVTVRQINKMPVANAGTDMSYPEGSNVSLNGTGSFDPDGQALVFNWLSLDGVVLFNSNSATPTFIAPAVQTDSDFRFSLTVNDGIVDSQADTVTIKVLQVNQIPLAHAGVDQTVNERDNVQLNGSLSSDPDNDDITYLWTAPPEVTLSSNTVAQPTFTAPSVRLDSILVFTLVVNDGQSNSLPDMVNISVKNIDVLSSDADIINVTLADLESADIDAGAATVALHMPYGYDVRNMSPDFELSTWATITPDGGTNRDFAIPQNYTVTAEDGSTTKIWTVSVHVPQHTLSRSIASGWNMLSLSVTPPDFGIDEVLSSLTFANLDYIKSPMASATWYSGYGWFGDLKELPASLAVRLKKATGGTLQLTGNEINPTLTGLPVVSGWNSLPYLLKANADINDAILPASIPNGDVLIKGEGGASIYFPGSGWVGDLQTMEVLHGYKLNLKNAGMLRYDAAALTTVPPAPKLKKATATNGFDNEYEYSATLVAELVNQNGQAITSENDILRAYSDGVLRGEKTADPVGNTGRYIFVLSYYSNNNGETINFKVVHNGVERELNWTKEFKSDEITGSASAPEKLVLPIATSANNPFGNGTISLSPNPASSFINISSDMEVLDISIYSATGYKVMQWNELSSSGRLNIAHLPNGVYFIEVAVSNGVHLHKFIKTTK
ncbi:Por secretion system C-terminal sorting domain-containing protein [Saccharicrinis carchari]|uniref:Por secretion system C-terminal sorting domain-containing protein n=1 Tax=Saccharicrinis carchari TaxID=1168039 RepID=A0A521DMP3_SACCC|nr:T9SS type A sorting domain-containing protein [Saccharicrinis carchari]SMO72956.1 Por secretion system C-terminal sorting domain-containing protein [Saccharicrinis carchari]